uniref:Sphingomyelin synthase-like domain-containing protein n=1 Tax=viral metagenome TaxID=1070528 RepID=A0A6C0LY91_9ZZZZ
MNIKLIAIAIIFHIFSTYCVHHIGNTHYHPSKSIKRNLDKVWDICHKMLPNYHYLEYIVNFFVLSIISYILCSKSFMKIFQDYLIYFPIIIIIRSIMILATILPKHKKCDSENLHWYSFVFGHCYDKIFSGHFSFVLLLTLSMLRYNIINLISAIIITFLNAFLLLSTRSHYTNDIIIAFFITHGVYNNCYISTLFN